MSQKNNKLRYVAYLRKSSDESDRQIISIPSQKKAIKEQFPELNIVRWIEESRSAFEPGNRNKFTNLVLKPIDREEYDGIVGWHPDRLSRNEIEAADITYRYRKLIIKSLKFCEYHIEHTPGKEPHYEVISNLQKALSEAQRTSAKLSVEVKRGLATKRDMGWRPSRSALGHLNDPLGEKGDKKIYPDPERFEIVKRVFKTILSRMHKPEEVRQMANNEWGLRTRKTKKQGGKPLSKSVFYAMLNNTFYTGYYKHNGKIIKGNHEPMITREEFEQVQIILGKHGKPTSHTLDHAYNGEMLCGECGAGITAEYKRHCVCTNCRHKFSCRQQTACPECDTDISEMRNPTIREYYTYHCTKKKGPCNQAVIHADKLEEQIDAHLAKLQMNDQYLKWAIRHLKAAHKLESDNQEKLLRSKQRAYDEATRKLNRLLELRMAEELDADEYQVAKQTAKEEQAKLRAEVEQSESHQHNWLELSERTFNFAAYARFWFADADKEKNLKKKRQILTTLGANLILQDKILQVEAPKPLQIIKEALEAIPEARLAQNPTSEPIKNAACADDKARETTPDSVVPEWSSFLNDVRTAVMDMQTAFFVPDYNKAGAF